MHPEPGGVRITVQGIGKGTNLTTQSKRRAQAALLTSKTERTNALGSQANSRINFGRRSTRSKVRWMLWKECQLWSRRSTSLRCGAKELVWYVCRIAPRICFLARSTSMGFASLAYGCVAVRKTTAVGRMSRDVPSAASLRQRPGQ